MIRPTPQDEQPKRKHKHHHKHKREEANMEADEAETKSRRPEATDGDQISLQAESKKTSKNITYDPEPKLNIVLDKRYQRGIVSKERIPIPPGDKVWGYLSSLSIPSINLQASPSALAVLDFLCGIRYYLVEDETARTMVLQKACQGPLEASWCIKTRFNFAKIETRFISWMLETDSWMATTQRLIGKKPLSKDLKTHIKHFNLVAMYMGLPMDSDYTKKLFIGSIGPNLKPGDYVDGDGSMLPLLTIESKVQAYDNMLSQTLGRSIWSDVEESAAAAVVSEEPQLTESEPPEEAAAAIISNQKPSGQQQSHQQHIPYRTQSNAESPQRDVQTRIKCIWCGKEGHYAEDCRKRKRAMGGKPAYVNTMQGKLLTQDCRIGKKTFKAIIDTGASINVITEGAARQINGKRYRCYLCIHTVGGDLHSKEAIHFRLTLGDIQTSIKAHVVKSAPADILLGTPFLLKQSEGYRHMLQEFGLSGKPSEPGEGECTVATVDELENLFTKYPNLVLEDDDIPDPSRCYKGQTFELGLPEEKRDKVYFKAQYPPDPTKIEVYRELLEPLMKAGVWVVSKSPHNNPTMLVPKKKPGQFRLVVDNRLVNRECKPVGAMSATPLSIIRQMGGAKVFTTLDCKNAFYSLVLSEKDREYTAISPPGMPRLELTRMPMGAKASTAALYQAMVNTLGEALYRYALVWADDIIIYSKSMEDHVRHVDDILKRLDDNGFCIARSKIELAKPEVKWLGYKVSAEGVRPDDDKIKELLSMRSPHSIKELHSAIGMWTYFSHFIPEYSIIAAPLFNQLKKGNTSLTWTAECQQAWKLIKEKLSSPPILAFPDFKQPLFMHTDACMSGFAAILTQERDGRHVLVDAISRTTNKAEKNYDPAKLECACVIWAVKKYKHFLYAVPITTVVTDSHGLQYLQQKNNESALVQRWLCEIEGFNLVVKYHKGTENIADFLSRQRDIQKTTVERESMKTGVAAPVSTRSMERSERIDFSALSKNGIRKMKAIPEEERKSRRPAKRARNGHGHEPAKQKRRMSLPEKSEEGDSTPTLAEIIQEQAQDSNVQRLWMIAQGKDVYQPTDREKQDAEGMTIINGVIIKAEPLPNGEWRRRIVVPLSLQRRIAIAAHNQNHSGQRGTYAVMRQYHWFRGMKLMAKQVAGSCERCISRKGRALVKEKLSPDQRPLDLGGRWHLDGLQLPDSGGYDHLMVGVDAATKYIILKPSSGETARAAVSLVKEIRRRFGSPREITTDQGSAFTSFEFKELCDKLHIHHKPVGVGQPQANGMVERVNRDILQMISIICHGNKRIWAQHIDDVEYALNTRVSSVTNHCPYELVLGRLPPGPEHTRFLTEGDIEPGEDKRMQKLSNRILYLQQDAAQHQRRAAELQKRYHDAHATDFELEVGDTVWKYEEKNVARGVIAKLDNRWSGPYTISQVIGPVTFILMDKNGIVIPKPVHKRLLYKIPKQYQ